MRERPQVPPATDGYRRRHPIDPDSTPPNNGDMERLAKLEATVEHIQSDVTSLKADVRELRGDIRDVRKDMRDDFRILFGALILVALGLATIMAKGFHWL